MSKLSLREKLKKDIILLDGAFGTYAQHLGLSEEHFKDVPGCMEYLSLSSPDFVRRIHSDYLEAGADAVETNTFGGNGLKFKEFGIEDKVYDFNYASTKLAREICDEFATRNHPRFVIGSMGPTGKLPSSTDKELGNISYQDLKKIFFEQAIGIIDGGADALLIETGQDLLEMKAAVNGAKEAIKYKSKDLLLMAQCTLSNNGRMLLGTEISAFSSVFSYMGIDVTGVNCSTGPVEMEGAIKFLSDNCRTFVSCVPNAGLPIEKNGKTVYTLSADEMADIFEKFLKLYRMNIVGGCCGTDPVYIKRLRQIVDSSLKKDLDGRKRFFSSVYKGTDLDRIVLPVKIGERINTHGSRKMKELLKANDHDAIIEMGKSQENTGADLLDVCTVLTERKTEKEDTIILFRNLAESVQVPLMVDSTSVDVIQAALENYAGTGFINSINLEDGGGKARKVFNLAKEHASYIVCLVIDQKGMAKTVDRKLEIAEKMISMAVDEYNIERHRLIFDMLTFTLGTGEEEYIDSALKTFEAIRSIKKRYPEVLTVLGVSNVSFGLPRQGRKILNRIFLDHAVKNGLDMCIINPADYVEIGTIAAEEIKLAEDLIFCRDKEALNSFVEHFSAKEKEKLDPENLQLESKESETIEERIIKCIFDRDKKNILDLIDKALAKYRAEDIINNILMPAMKDVGEKLDSGDMVLPFVLQSAEVMRKALEHLEGFMEKAGSSRGKILMATVFGDVHDIGKNLVKMILQNHGFTVIDLGKQVPIDTIVASAKKHKVDAVGLSALLVSTARHMQTCVQAMHDAGLEYPLLIGGAPISSNFARDISFLNDKSLYNGGVFYAKDAFTGLNIVQALMSPESREKLMREYFDRSPSPGPNQEKVSFQNFNQKNSTNMSFKNKVPRPPFYGIRTLNNIPVDEVFSFVDKERLFNLGWGAKLKDEKEKVRIIKEEYTPLLEELKQEIIKKGLLQLRAVYGYFNCRVIDNELIVINKNGEVLETISFKPSKDNTSLADYFLKGEGLNDLVCFQAVTVGNKINNEIARLSDNKEVTKAYFLHGVSVYLTEALAAYIHSRIRTELSLKNDQGKRYSPGYPLWGDMRDQEKLFKILDLRKRLGIELTEGFQMVPEQSTTAMVVYNEKAKY